MSSSPALPNKWNPILLLLFVFNYRHTNLTHTYYSMTFKVVSFIASYKGYSIGGEF